ncbi:MarR family winged helix-turn-helix transcriptional regulator [Streptomyces sp. PT12]|uniref:MarR family winged helix-turn-helix transcriptional regulator n=1 Tax=Streptomyces sp. PT12 TaxID=1510197 RepID=UPI000DE42604|nr:MarR family transcriptional regulator [Streptomyces sp. PT12]RBM22113.1 MarR family transcriptional regulator [Streptomyces sp. PT12]
MPDIGPRPPSLLALPSHLTSQVARFGHRLLEEALGSRGVPLAHHAILTALEDFGPMSQQRLAAALDLDKSHLVGRIDRLERAGLAARTRDPDDRRRHRVTLTPKGAALLAELRLAAAASQERFLAPLNAKERGTFNALLRRLLAASDESRRSM